MAPRKDTDWQAPSFMEKATDRMGWVEEQIGESESWLKGQALYKDLQTNIALVEGRSPDNQTRSALNTNYLKYCARKIIATLADAKEIATFGSDAKQFQGQAEQMNRVVRAIYLESHFPQALKRVMQWGLLGVGYMWPKFKRDNYGFGEGKVVFEDLGPMDVLPVQMPKSSDVQGAYNVTCIEFMPVAEAHGRFPAFQSSLVPVAKKRYKSSITNQRMTLAEKFRYGDSGGSWANLYCEIRYTFIRDVSVNTSGMKLPMGEPGTSWYYEVPSLGDDIPAGVSLGGVFKVRKAGPEDCLIYPYLRLIITAAGMKEPMYDGPAFDWSGMIPPVPYMVDSWPWEDLGYSLIGDIASMENAKKTIERGMDQIAKHRLDPGLAYDRGSGVGSVTMEGIDPFEERIRMGVDGKVRDVVDTILPEYLLNVPEWEFKYHDLLKNMMEAQLGLNDIGNLAEMKASLQGEGAEKILAKLGPIVKDIGFAMESSTSKVAQQLKFMVPQYFDTKRLMTYLGPDQVTQETFDYEPENLVPSHMLDELQNIPQSVVDPGPSVYSRTERARRFAQNLRLVSVPSSLHEWGELSEQLKYLQLWRGGFPIAAHDVAKKLRIEGYGEIEGNTMWDRWVKEQNEKIILTAKAQQLAGAVMGGSPQEPGQGPGGGQKKSGGRPPSGGAPPKLKQKGAASGNPRVTTVESR